jgi:hypothetical protein
MITVTQPLVATMFQNPLVMTTTPVLMTTVIPLPANVFTNQFHAMIIMHVLMMNVYPNLVAVTAM